MASIAVITVHATLVLLVGFVFFLRLSTLIRWQETHLQVLNRASDHSVGLLFLSLLSFGWLLLVIRIRAVRIRHAFILPVVFVYAFLFFNPQVAIRNAQKAEAESILCPDGLAYGIGEGTYIRCEDFDRYFEARHRGEVLRDLWIRR